MFDPRTGMAKHTQTMGILVALAIGAAMIAELFG